MIRRDKYLNKLVSGIKNDQIKVITGIRRCGKSYLLSKIFKDYLLKQGIQEEQIIYFAFDNQLHLNRLDKYLPKEDTKIFKSKDSYVINNKKFLLYIEEMTKKNQDYYLLLDEIQLLDDFVAVLNGLLSIENYDTYVTGSNSKFLSSDIETKFRGRDYQVHMMPLSFSEFSENRNEPFGKLYLEYSVYGGLPLILKYQAEEDKENYLKEAFRELYTKDLIERYHIESEEKIIALIQFLSSNIGSQTNPSKIEKTFRSVLNQTYGDDTIVNHVHYMENAFLLNECKRFDIKGRKYIGANNKYYFQDIGIRNAILNFRQVEQTHIMENIIYNELLYRGYSVDAGVVEKNIKIDNHSKRIAYEADFVCNKSDKKIYIQSAFSIADEEKYKQEEKSLLSILDTHQKVIITQDNIPTHYTEDGILILRLDEFLMGREF